MKTFKVGDHVILNKANVPRRGVIVEEPYRHYMYSHIRGNDGSIEETELANHPPIAFYGENNYFDWLHNCEQYLTHDTDTSSINNS